MYKQLASCSYSILRNCFNRQFLLYNRSGCEKRFITYSCSCCSTPQRPQFNLKREAKMLKKMVTGARKSRKKFLPFDQPASAALSEFGFMTKGKAKPVSGKVMRRVEVLNTLFIEQITSLLATGEVSPEFIGLGLQISRVKISPDFSAVNVYWYASGTEKDEKIDVLLKGTAGHLRHTLSQLRIMGVVPPIIFIKDRTFSKLQEVESLLSKCDFGPDFKSPDPAESFLKSPKSGAIIEAEKFEPKEMDVKVVKNLPTVVPDTDQLSIKNYDVFGVKHSLIMNEIINSLSKQRQRKMAKEKKHSFQQLSLVEQDDESLVVSQNEARPMATEDIGNIDSENYRKRQSEFLKYLKKRQATKMKEVKRNTVEAKEKEFYMSEAEERWTINVQSRLLDLDGDILEKDDIDSDEYYSDEEYYQDFRKEFE